MNDELKREVDALRLEVAQLRLEVAMLRGTRNEPIIIREPVYPPYYPSYPWPYYPIVTCSNTNSNGNTITSHTTGGNA